MLTVSGYRAIPGARVQIRPARLAPARRSDRCRAARDDFQRAGQDIKKGVRQATSDAEDTARDAARDADRGLDRAADRTRNAADEAGDRARETGDRARNAAADAADETKHGINKLAGSIRSAGEEVGATLKGEAHDWEKEGTAWDAHGRDERDFRDRARDAGRDWQHRADRAGRDWQNRADDAGRDWQNRFEDTGRDWDRQARGAGRDFDRRVNNAGREFEDRARDTGRRVQDFGERLQEDENLQSSSGYGLMIAYYAFSAVAMLFAPAQVLKYMFKVTLPVAELLNTTMMRLLGAATIPAITSALALKNASDNHRLDSPTYRRINLAFIFHSIGILVMQFITHGDINTNNNMAISITSAVVVLLVALRGYSNGIRNFDLGRVIEGIVNSAVDLFHVRNIRSAIYSVLTIAALAMGTFPTLFATQDTSFMLFAEGVGPIGLYLKRLVGLSLLFSASLLYNLKAAADRGRLGGTTFKVANFGLGTMSASMLAVLTWALNNNIGTAGAWLNSLKLVLGVTAAWAYFNSLQGGNQDEHGELDRPRDFDPRRGGDRNDPRYA